MNRQKTETMENMRISSKQNASRKHTCVYLNVSREIEPHRSYDVPSYHLEYPKSRPAHQTSTSHTPPWTCRSVCDSSNSRKQVKTQQKKSLETVANTTRKIHARTLHRRKSNACLAKRLHMTRAVVLWPAVGAHRFARYPR